MTPHHDHMGANAHFGRAFVKYGGNIRRPADVMMPDIDDEYDGWWIYWMVPEAFLLRAACVPSSTSPHSAPPRSARCRLSSRARSPRSAPCGAEQAIKAAVLEGLQLETWHLRDS